MMKYQQNNSNKININLYVLSLIIFICGTKVYAQHANQSYIDSALDILNQQQKYIANGSEIQRQSKLSESVSMSMQMKLFNQNKLYECPIFSNSPYSSLIGTIEELKTDLDSLFPPCSGVDTKNLKDKLNTIREETDQSSGSSLNLIDATGIGKKISYLTAIKTFKTELLQLVNTTNNAITCAQVATLNRKSNITKVNDFIQAVSPAATDLISKLSNVSGANPVISKGLKAALIGADFAKESINLIDQFSKLSSNIDITDHSNQENLLKNVCYFMKIYNRVESLNRANRDGVENYLATYETKLNSLNLIVAQKKQATAAVFPSIEASQIPKPLISVLQNVSDEKLLKSLSELEESIQHIVFKVGITEYNFSRANQSNSSQQQDSSVVLSKDLNSPDMALTKCESYTEIKKIVKVKNIINQINSVVGEFNTMNFDNSDVVWEAAMSTYNRETQRFDNIYLNDIASESAKGNESFGRCSQFAPSWVTSLNNLIVETRNLINRKKAIIYNLGTPNEKLWLEKVKADYASTQNLIFNLKMLKSLISDKDIVFSHVTSLFPNLYVNLFGSLNKTESGPVFDLLMYKQKVFNEYYNVMMNAVNYVLNYEITEAMKLRPNQQIQNNQTRNLSKMSDYILQVRQKSFLLENVKLNQNNKSGGLIIGTSTWEKMCDKVNLALTYYDNVASQLMGSQGICNMIKPVLKEQLVSKRLYSFCTDENAQFVKVFFSLDNFKIKTLNEMHEKLLGVSYYNSKNSGLSEQELQIKKDFSPRNLIAHLIQKQKELKCSDGITNN